jgi:hypothetical protein
MTGPQYPRPRPAGSNAIGTFAIGISPIGTMPPFDYWKTIISEYGNSDLLTTLIGNMWQYLDQTKNMDDFFDLIWNVDTAQGYGLDVWGRIVGVTRTLHIVAGNFFGFEQGPWDDFGPSGGESPFYKGAASTSNYLLTDHAYRFLIFAKALANISNGSIPSINQILRLLFPGRGNAYATDDGNMTMRYKFEFALAPFELAIVTQSNVLPKSTGVSCAVDAPT